MSDRDRSGPQGLEQFMALDDQALESALDRQFGGDGASQEAAAFADLCRDALAPELGGPAGESGERGSQVLRERRVTERVLARSTREDLRRRADLGLVLDMRPRPRSQASKKVLENPCFIYYPFFSLPVH